jgi:hypothetical protein
MEFPFQLHHRANSFPDCSESTIIVTTGFSTSKLSVIHDISDAIAMTPVRSGANPVDATSQHPAINVERTVFGSGE